MTIEYEHSLPIVAKYSGSVSAIIAAIKSSQDSLNTYWFFGKSYFPLHLNNALDPIVKAELTKFKTGSVHSKKVFFKHGIVDASFGYMEDSNNDIAPDIKLVQYVSVHSTPSLTH